uniref:BTB domain-containing protein n=1 Tax=Psilocybe cubensis TaxID=181762 RepID=A0A8H7XV64_PSICU
MKRQTRTTAVDATDSDITIISGDNVAFKLHRKYLDVNTGVFPGAEIVDSKEEPIHLQEPASVLAIVFQFLYPRKHPKLNDESFDTVLAVSEAVEKYQVFSAMNTCETRLIKYLQTPEHAAEILGHAIKHDYPDIINTAVPHLARAPLMPLLEKLPQHCVLPWVRSYGLS